MNLIIAGLTDDIVISILLTSRGTPMLLSGDEFANTQRGNNNACYQDNEIYGTKKDAFIYVAVNAYREDMCFELPQLPEGFSWHTALRSDDLSMSAGKEKADRITLLSRSTAVLIGE